MRAMQSRPMEPDAVAQQGPAHGWEFRHGMGGSGRPEALNASSDE